MKALPIFGKNAGEMKGEKKDKFGKAAATGVVAVVFFLIGLQSALFIVKFVSPGKGGFTPVVDSSRTGEIQPARRSAKKSGGTGTYRGGSRVNVKRGGSAGGGGPNEGRQAAPEPELDIEPELFPFDPNIASEEEFERLGFSPKQAASILRWREAGGTFFCKKDFKKMYSVSDSAYRRLEPYIKVTALEINGADSAALERLPGIGPYYAAQIVAYRKRIGGYSDIRQLMEVKGMSEETFEKTRECVRIDSAAFKPLDLWKMSEDSLARHPYIGSYAAKEIARFKKSTDSSEWNIEKLTENGIIALSPSRRRQFRP